jgi:2,3-dihydroxybiphenyl 1,2-dioxygenase
MSISALGYLGFEVSDLDAWTGFAAGTLGVMPADGSSDVRRFRVDSQAWRLEARKGGRDDLAVAGFEVAGEPELRAMAERLKGAGVAVAEGGADLVRDRGVCGLVSCRDPDGLDVEIYYGPTLATEAPFASPVGVSGFVTGQQGVGHIVLATQNIARTRAFYQDVLGFRVSDYIRMRMGPELFIDLEFYHCNPRHHTIALLPLPMAPPKRMHHFMLQARTIDDVGFALDRASKAGVPITQGLGRHTNDQMVSFYAQTPSGFEVEFGYGALEVDDETWRVTRHDKASSWGHRRPGAERG